jgi:hypothetical protein
MLVVLDDVLDEAHRQAVVGFFSQSDEARSIKWEAGEAAGLEGNNSPMALLLKEAGKYFDLSSMVGSEYWAHYGTRSDWHVDKDEKLHEETGEIRCPICSIVYYADINVEGGNFLTKTSMVRPVTNRMLVFSPNILHCVEPYTGTRLSVAVNPWAYKPLTHI